MRTHSCTHTHKHTFSFVSHRSTHAHPHKHAFRFVIHSDTRTHHTHTFSAMLNITTARDQESHIQCRTMTETACLKQRQPRDAQAGVDGRCALRAGSAVRRKHIADRVTRGTVARTVNDSTATVPCEQITAGNTHHMGEVNFNKYTKLQVLRNMRRARFGDLLDHISIHTPLLIYLKLKHRISKA